MYVWIWLILPTLMIIATLFVVFQMQQRIRKTLLLQQEAWERAHDARLKKWRIYQDQRLGQLEQQFIIRLESAANRQQAREEQEAHQREEFKRQMAGRLEAERIEYILAQVPRTEDIPLPASTQISQHTAEPARPPLHLAGADLTWRDLSRRYLRQANLQQAKLAHANFFMADLSEADFSGADLSGANLSGANLTSANLSNTNLTGTNFLVADLNNARLTGAQLHQARNLTLAQLATVQEASQPDRQEKKHGGQVPEQNNQKEKLFVGPELLAPAQ
jgi:hypothetical protein